MRSRRLTGTPPPKPRTGPHCRWSCPCPVLHTDDAAPLPGCRPSTQAATGRVSATVTVSSPDGQAVVVPGVTVTSRARCASMGDVTADEQADLIRRRSCHDCAVTADPQGFKSATTAVLVKANATADVTLRLELEQLHDRDDGRRERQAIDANPIAAQVDRLNAALMQTASHRERALSGCTSAHPRRRPRPGRPAERGGARSNQTALRFNNADGTDPRDRRRRRRGSPDA